MARQSRFARPEHITHAERLYLQARYPADAVAEQCDRIETILRKWRYAKLIPSIHCSLLRGMQQWVVDEALRHGRPAARERDKLVERARVHLAKAAAAMRALVLARMPRARPINVLERQLFANEEDRGGFVLFPNVEFVRQLSDDDLIDLRQVIVTMPPRRRGRPESQARHVTEAGLRKAGVSTFDTRELLDAFRFIDEGSR